MERLQEEDKASVIVHKGLEEIYVKRSAISFMDSVRGKVFYRVFDVAELCKYSTFEEVAYLILNDDLPNKEQLREFDQNLKNKRELPKEVVKVLRLLPKTAHPMDALKVAVAFLASFDSELRDNSKDANIRKAIRLIARLPSIVSTFDRLRKGLEPISPNPELSHSANFLYMLSGEKPDHSSSKAIEASMILYIEHEMNTSTFAAIVTISSLSDIYSSILSAIGALQGPLHGGAIEASFKMLKDVGSPERAEGYVEKAIASKLRIVGFGHRVYRSLTQGP